MVAGNEVQRAGSGDRSSPAPPMLRPHWGNSAACFAWLPPQPPERPLTAQTRRCADCFSLNEGKVLSCLIHIASTFAVTFHAPLPCRSSWKGKCRGRDGGSGGSGALLESSPEALRSVLAQLLVTLVHNEKEENAGRAPGAHEAACLRLPPGRAERRGGHHLLTTITTVLSRFLRPCPQFLSTSPAETVTCPAETGLGAR